MGWPENQPYHSPQIPLANQKIDLHSPRDFATWASCWCGGKSFKHEELRIIVRPIRAFWTCYKEKYSVGWKQKFLLKKEANPRGILQSTGHIHKCFCNRVSSLSLYLLLFSGVCPLSWRWVVMQLIHFSYIDYIFLVYQYQCSPCASLVLVFCLLKITGNLNMLD